MGIVQEFRFEPLGEGDPDDFRPNSSLAIVLDPSGDSPKVVRSLTLLFEHMAAGDRIPMHKHDIDEVIVIDEGTAEVTVGEVRKSVGAGAVIFIPSGTPHGTRNLSESVLRLHAIFPSQTIPIQYLDRNPAPGTEADSPQPPFSIDARELIEGNPKRAIRPL
jgi:mannose-6-phosphate isomerase-like protein (cupin superfamily)